MARFRWPGNGSAPRPDEARLGLAEVGLGKPLGGRAHHLFSEEEDPGLRGWAEKKVEGL